jgi:pilus assembly protein CpaB
VVNLLVSPEQAEQLSLATSQTHIQLVLRNPLDTQIAQTTGTAVGNLYTGGAAPAAKAKTVATPHAAAKPQPPVYVIQVYNGSKQSEQKFASGEEKQ